MKRELFLKVITLRLVLTKRLLLIGSFRLMIANCKVLSLKTFSKRVKLGLLAKKKTTEEPLPKPYHPISSGQENRARTKNKNNQTSKLRGSLNWQSNKNSSNSQMFHPRQSKPTLGSSSNSGRTKVT